MKRFNSFEYWVINSLIVEKNVRQQCPTFKIINDSSILVLDKNIKMCSSLEISDVIFVIFVVITFVFLKLI
ncbi:hypothetical protein [Mycoplasmopsis lipofaciens]|uniref:hypothetical protein n=1 Tax=Mycoplasmopsis lipofaciens TaxID=114884 RepID=UPI0012EB1159|nr:hypothetical protein [Mycoplasmopsis lipofaciens]